MAQEKPNPTGLDLLGLDPSAQRLWELSNMLPSPTPTSSIPKWHHSIQAIRFLRLVGRQTDPELETNSCHHLCCLVYSFVFSFGSPSTRHLVWPRLPNRFFQQLLSRLLILLFFLRQPRNQTPRPVALAGSFFQQLPSCLLIRLYPPTAPQPDTSSGRACRIIYFFNSCHRAC